MNRTLHSLYCYFLALSQPVRFLDFLKHNIPVQGFTPDIEVKNNFWRQSALWSWGFYILGSFLEALVLMAVIFYLVNSQGEYGSFDFLLRSQNDYILTLKLAFIWTGFKILSFPVLLFFGNLIRFVSIRMVLGLWDGKKRESNEIWEIVGLSNTSYSFFCVPFLGKLAGEWSQFILLYRGLRWRLGWGRGKTILTIFIPNLLFWGLVITSTLFILLAV